MTAIERALIEKIRQLPPQRMAEVEDFVDFLRARADEQRLTHAATKASRENKLINLFFAAAEVCSSIRHESRPT